MNLEILEALMYRCGLGEEFAKQEAVFLWPEVVGRLGAFAEASFVRDGVLHITAHNAAVAQELNLLTTELLNQLNKRLRGERLHGIRIATGDVPRRRQKVVPTAESTVGDVADGLFGEIENPELRAAFVELCRRQRRREAATEANGGRRCPRCGVTYVGREPFCPGCRYDAFEESSEAN
jgi:hypothetical protein